MTCTFTTWRAGAAPTGTWVRPFALATAGPTGAQQARPDGAVHATDPRPRRRHPRRRRRPRRRERHRGHSAHPTIGMSRRHLVAPAPVPAAPCHRANAATRPAPPDPRVRAPPAALAPRPPADGRDAPDPFVLADGDRWALYSTQVGFLNVPVATSPDLATWSAPTDALPELPGWAEWGRTWAPGSWRDPAGSSSTSPPARQRPAGSASAPPPRRRPPARSPARQPSRWCASQSWAGRSTPIRSSTRTGRAYLLWKADGNAVGGASVLFAQRLGPDGLTLAGDAVPLLQNDAAWEAPLIENPALVRLDGRYTAALLGRLVGVGQLRHRLRDLRHPARPVHEGDHRAAAPRQRRQRRGSGRSNGDHRPGGRHVARPPRLGPRGCRLRGRRGAQPSLLTAGVGRRPAGRSTRLTRCRLTALMGQGWDRREDCQTEAQVSSRAEPSNR